MKKATLFLILAFLSFALVPLLVPHKSNAISSSQVRIENIHHVVTPIYGGLLLINDTIEISSTTENATIESFSIGFPNDNNDKYRKNLRFSMAHEAENFNERLSVILDTGLGVTGYYGVTVVFPSEVRNLLYSGRSYTFSVIFVFSDLIESTTKLINGTTEYVSTADFPVYPSLTQNASTCNVTVVLPENANYTENDFPFDATKKGEVYFLNYTKINLPKFTRVSTKVSFVSENKNDFVCISVSQLNREITIDTSSSISISEQFLLKSKTIFTVDSIKIRLLENASNVLAFDEQGKELNIKLQENETDTYEISLNLVEDQSRSFRLIYNLQRENYVVQQDSQSYKLTLNLSKSMRIMPIAFNLKIVFPEGAAVQSFPQETFDIHRDVFRDVLSLSLFNTTWLQNEQWSLAYSYTVFWTSFRPTLWTTVLVIIGSIIVFAWQRPKAPVLVSVVLVPRKTLNAFVEIYEEKKKTLSELEQMKMKVRKGKISRRRYKVRKTTLENRISALSRRLMDLQQKIMGGGAKYAGIMRQLEVAETELDNIREDIKRIEVRFKRGEISASTYRRLLESDLGRQEKARRTVDGLLLRLRE